MGDRTCSHCNNENEDDSTLELCSVCEQYIHHRCIDRCPVLEKRKRFLKAAGIGVAAGVGAVAAAPLVLTAVGFTSAGVAGGSIAAGIQSAVYGGATTGAFSALQSAGAAGLSAATQAGIGGAAGGVAGWIKWKLS